MYSPYSADFSKSPYPTIFHEHGQQFRSMATSSLSTRHREQLNCAFSWAILKPHGAVKVVSGETPVGAMRPMCSCNQTIFCHSGQPRLPPRCPSRGGPNRRSPGPFACCLPRLYAQDNKKSRKTKTSAMCGLYIIR